MDNPGYWIYCLLIVVPLWRIFIRVGMSGPLALLLLIPGVGYFVTLGVLAFSKWPKIDTKERQ